VNFNARALAPHHIASQIAESLALAEPVDDEHPELEVRPIHVIGTGHTDTVDDLAARPGHRSDRLRLRVPKILTTSFPEILATCR
jgi:hypothetical protein